MGRAIVKTCKRAWSGAARPTFIVALLVLVPVCVVLIHSALRASSGTITVNTTGDPSTTGSGCSLREAINNANNPGTDQTNLDCTEVYGATTLINFSVSGTITIVGSDLPHIAKTLTIDGTGYGPGYTITVNGASTYQLLTVNGGATLTLNDLTLAHGVGFNGGGIFNGGTLTVTNSTFSGNNAYNGGGGIFNAGTASVTNSTFFGNSGAYSGALQNQNDSVPPTLTVTNCTFTGNSATLGNTYGAGVILNYPTAPLYNNTATFYNSILANNSGGNCTTGSSSTLPIDGGYNIDDDGSCSFTGSGTSQHVNPLLDPNGLQNNGGPTETISLQAGSPAIAAVLPASCTVGTDQRGDLRPYPGPPAQTNCDIGAFEGDNVTLTGSVQGDGVTGISGSTVTLYAAGGSAYGSGATPLATATTADDGTFTLTFPQPVPGNPQTYITATGGSVSPYGPNSAIGLMAALGPANSLVDTTTITINELTTAAAEWSLTQFLDPTGRIVGAPATNTLGLQNAYISFANLADINSSNLSVSGNPSTFLPSGGSCPGPVNCDGLERLNTLANILAGCVQSDPSGTACAQLLCDATPGDLYGTSCTTPVPAITDTLGAAYQIVANPANNVGPLYGLAGGTPFAPTLAAQPDGWEMGLNFAPARASFSYPLSLALDASGNVFVANNSGGSDTAGSVSELTTASDYRTGVFFDNTSSPSASFSGPVSLALDKSSNVFVANIAGGTGPPYGSVSELDRAQLHHRRQLRQCQFAGRGLRRTRIASAGRLGQRLRGEWSKPHGSSLRQRERADSAPLHHRPQLQQHRLAGPVVQRSPLDSAGRIGRCLCGEFERQQRERAGGAQLRHLGLQLQPRGRVVERPLLAGAGRINQRLCGERVRQQRERADGAQLHLGLQLQQHQHRLARRIVQRTLRDSAGRIGQRLCGEFQQQQRQRVDRGEHLRHRLQLRPPGRGARPTRLAGAGRIGQRVAGEHLP